MGADLYWKKTPKPKDEEFIGLKMSTWGFLSELWEIEDRRDFDEKELNRTNLPQLEAVYLTAKTSSNKELADDIKSLIDGIKKHQSITLNVRH